MPVTCCGVALNLKVRMLITAKSARKSPKTEMVCAYQRRRIIGMRITSPMESGAGISGSMGGFGIDSAGAGLGEVVLMRDESMVLDYPDERVRTLPSIREPLKFPPIRFSRLPPDLLRLRG